MVKYFIVPQRARSRRPCRTFSSAKLLSLNSALMDDQESEQNPAPNTHMGVMGHEGGKLSKLARNCWRRGPFLTLWHAQFSLSSVRHQLAFNPESRADTAGGAVGDAAICNIPAFQLGDAYRAPRPQHNLLRAYSAGPGRPAPLPRCERRGKNTSRDFYCTILTLLMVLEYYGDELHRYTK